MPTSTYNINVMTKENCGPDILDEIALIHQTTLPDGFLSNLGTPFLRTIYRELATDPRSHLVFASSHENKVIGFICGTESTADFYKRFLIRNTLPAIWTLLPKMFSLQLLKKIFETLFIPCRTQKIKLPTAQLLNFCVSKQHQGEGIGGQLYHHLMRWFQGNNINEVVIITGNKQKMAQSFYEKQGLQQKNLVSLHGDDKSLVYVWESNTTKCTP